MRYAVEQLWEQAAYLAYYLHWSFDAIVALPHSIRHQMIDEVGKIHAQLGVATGADN